jgi:hypothetical protein
MWKELTEKISALFLLKRGYLMSNYTKYDGSVIEVDTQTGVVYLRWLDTIREYARFRNLGRFPFWSCGEYLRRSDFPSTNVGFKRFLKYTMPRHYDIYCTEKFKAMIMSQLIEEVCRNT